MANQIKATKSTVRDAAKALSDLGAAKGGKARAAVLSSEERSEIARKAAAARWEGKQVEGIAKSVFTGELEIGNLIFPCSVLSDGTRILTQSNFMKGMGMYYSGWVARNKVKTPETAGLPHFMAFKSIEPFIEKHLGDLESIVVKYRTEKGALAHGIKAEIIPKICEVWMDADEYSDLGARQKRIAENAKMLMRALAHVGIIALVDEATGYQEIRDRKALQQILDKYISKELLAWTKKFPDEFYEQLFRLQGWEWRGMSVPKPSYVGKLTNDIVYARLAPGVLAELKRITPRNERGRLKYKMHQYLSQDVGNPSLSRHLQGVIALMRASTDWDTFYQLLERAFKRQTPQLELELDT